jgi:hypothetical protein
MDLGEHGNMKPPRINASRWINFAGADIQLGCGVPGRGREFGPSTVPMDAVAATGRALVGAHQFRPVSVIVSNGIGCNFASPMRRWILRAMMSQYSRVLLGLAVA